MIFRLTLYLQYVANMHGNEVRGRGLLLKFAYYLAMSYESDQDVRDIMATTVFHLLPTINPDGFASATKSCSGVDGRLVIQYRFYTYSTIAVGIKNGF